jgi:hypothetical protein
MHKRRGSLKKSGQSGACIDRFRVLCNSTDDPHLFLLLLLLLFSIVKKEPTRVGKGGQSMPNPKIQLWMVG